MFGEGAERNEALGLWGAVGASGATVGVLAVAAAHAKTLTHQGEAATAALTGGFQWALWVCGAIALLAIPVTLALVRSDDVAAVTELAAADDGVLDAAAA
jgi:hypothetical protein